MKVYSMVYFLGVHDATGQLKSRFCDPSKFLSRYSTAKTSQSSYSVFFNDRIVPRSNGLDITVVSDRQMHLNSSKSLLNFKNSDIE